MSLWEKIKQVFSQPKQLVVLTAGLGLFTFYTLYARKQLFNFPQKRGRNILDINISQLNSKKEFPNICKIVITQSSSMSSAFKKLLVTRLKQFLMSNSFNTLVNCAPLKLFHAGAQVFVGYINQQNPDTEQEQQLMSYFENALKCHLIVERTIIDIDQIKNKQKQTFVLCDTNSLDIKVHNNKQIWNKFIQKYQINQNNLTQNYNIVFHVKGSQNSIPAEFQQYRFKQFQPVAVDRVKKDQIEIKIQETWKNVKNYHVLEYNPYLMLEENVQIAMEQIVTSLRSYLPCNLTYVRRRVFAKQW